MALQYLNLEHTEDHQYHRGRKALTSTRCCYNDRLKIHVCVCSEMEGDLRAKDQQLLKTQGSLTEAQEDLARDEVIFAGKVKELQELREANEQLQVSCASHQAQLGQKVVKQSVLKMPHTSVKDIVI